MIGPFAKLLRILVIITYNVFELARHMLYYLE